MTTIQITKEVVEKTLQDGAKSITEIYKKLGGKSKVSSSFSKKMRETFPNLDTRLRENQDAKPKVAETPFKTHPIQKAKKSSLRFSKHPQNPFREGSSYFTCFNILAAHPKGLNKDELVRLLAKTTGKSEKLAGYDASVVLSAKESPTGMRHRSCKEGFWVHKENKFAKLII